jgi:hypothetical protein
MPNEETCCAKCRRPIREDQCVAAISGRIMGDTCTDCYYWCDACGVYTLRMYRDVFVGPETESEGQQFSKEEGDRRVYLIRRCTEPGNERCRCEWHRAYFGEWLD